MRINAANTSIIFINVEFSSINLSHLRVFVEKCPSIDVVVVSIKITGTTGLIIIVLGVVILGYIGFFVSVTAKVSEVIVNCNFFHSVFALVVFSL